MKSHPKNNKEIATVVYLHEVDELLGGDALNLQDLVLISASNIQWHKESVINDEWMVS